MLWQLNSIFPAAVNLAVPLEFGILFYSLLSAAVSLLLEKCLEKDMIFGWYYERLVNTWNRLEKQHDRRRLWLKPIGLCVYCYGVWISIATFYLIFGSEWVLLPFFCGMAYLWLRITQKLIS